MEALIDIQNLIKDYRSFRLDLPSFRLERGTILGLVGPNGAGKSTLIKILMGMVRPDQGEVRVLGLPVPAEERAIKAQVGFLSEDMSLYEALSVGWHLDFVSRCYPEWDRDYADRLLRRLELDPAKKVGSLSRGTRVKLQLLLAMARRPSLLIMDEPTSGLDPLVRSEFLAEMMQVVLEEEHAVLFSSHLTADVERCADLVGFLKDGRMVECADKVDLLERWRTLRFTAEGPFPPSGLTGVLSAEWQGRSALWISENFDPAQGERIRRMGGRDLSAERMTLEEIFLARMRRPEGERSAS